VDTKLDKHIPREKHRVNYRRLLFENAVQMTMHIDGSRDKAVRNRGVNDMRGLGKGREARTVLP